MRRWDEDHAWQTRFRDHFAEIALAVVRVEVASWEDDARRNTDMLIGVLANGSRIMCRARTFSYRLRYPHDITIRYRRPSGVPTEMDKIRQGYGDFFAYGFEAFAGSDRLHPWCLSNVALIREHLDGNGRWRHRPNHDNSSDLAVFTLEDLPAGTILASDGHDTGDALLAGRWGPCRYCGRPAWAFADDGKAAHPCCAREAVERPGAPCLACTESDRLNHYRYGWPEPSESQESW